MKQTYILQRVRHYPDGRKLVHYYKSITDIIPMVMCVLNIDEATRFVGKSNAVDIKKKIIREYGSNGWEVVKHK